MSTQKIIVFEGPDRCGKTTTKTIFDKITEYGYMSIDRFFVSSVAYAIDRHENIDRMIERYSHILHVNHTHGCKYIFVLFVPDQETVSHIANATHEHHIDVVKHNDLFKRAIDSLNEYLETHYSMSLNCVLVNISLKPDCHAACTDTAEYIKQEVAKYD